MRHHPSLRGAVAVFLMALALIASRASAAESNCDNAQTTAAMRACENGRYEKAEKDLNLLYGRLLKQMSPQRQAKLREAQRAWLNYRNANADFQASAAQQGTLAPLLRVSALADMDEARIKELSKEQK